MPCLSHVSRVVCGTMVRVWNTCLEGAFLPHTGVVMHGESVCWNVCAHLCIFLVVFIDTL